MLTRKLLLAAGFAICATGAIAQTPLLRADVAVSGDLVRIGDVLENRPEKEKVEGPQEPLNVLVMGSDTRDCDGCDLDNEVGGNASDTTILMHLSADRKRAYGVSIPRDTIVDRPSCKAEDGSRTAAATDVMWTMLPPAPCWTRRPATARVVRNAEWRLRRTMSSNVPGSVSRIGPNWSLISPPATCTSPCSGPSGATCAITSSTASGSRTSAVNDS